MGKGGRCGEIAFRGARLPAEAILTSDSLETIVYRECGERALRLLLMRPGSPGGAGAKRAAVVWIHGGGWTSGEPEQFAPHCRYMAMRGAVSFSVEYRLKDASASIGVADCLEDCRSAVRYIRDHADALGVDPKRIAVAGDSAGGHLAACLAVWAEQEPGVASSVPNALIACNAVFDLTANWREVLEQAPASPMEVEEAPHRPGTSDAMSESGEARAWFDLRREAYRLSPLHQVRGGQPPALIMHGWRDRTVHPEYSARFYEACVASGNPARLVWLPASRHAFLLFGYTAAPEETMLALGEIDHFLAELGYLEEGGR